MEKTFEITNETLYSGNALNVTVVDEDCRDIEITLKWDGCIDINTYSNGSNPEEVLNNNDVDYIHICDVQRFIKQLQEVVEIAKEKFSEEDFKRYWE